jgi:tetratricopeptide (TPR) repeat protein
MVRKSHPAVAERFPSMALKLSEAFFGSDDKAPSRGLLKFLAESAYLWSYRGQHDRAIPLFEAIVALAPGEPIGQLGLAQTFLSLGKFREAERAADLASRAASIDRRTLSYAYKLRGKALIQLNKPRDAEKALRRAAEMDPNGPEGKSALQLIEMATKLGILK